MSKQMNPKPRLDSWCVYSKQGKATGFKVMHSDFKSVVISMMFKTFHSKLGEVGHFGFANCSSLKEGD